VRKHQPSLIGPKDRAVLYMQKYGHQVLVAEDVDAKGIKRYTTFLNTAALQEADAYLETEGIDRHMYEVLLPSQSTRPYKDLDYSSKTGRDDCRFNERWDAYCSLRDRFFTEVLEISEDLLTFRMCTASGESGSSYKYSAHEVLQGFYLEDQSARALYKCAFLAFLVHPPQDLVKEAELVFYEKSNGVKEAFLGLAALRSVPVF
jgi:hypothetical protein